MIYTKKKKKKKKSTKEVKGIKINLDFIFNNFLVHRTGLRLVLVLKRRLSVSLLESIHILDGWALAVLNGCVWMGNKYVGSL